MNQPQIMNLLLPLALFGFLWFFMIRPQQQQRKKREEMLKNLKAGDQVVTIGGLHGTIKEVGEHSVVLDVGGGVRLTFQRSAIGALRSDAGK